LPFIQKNKPYLKTSTQRRKPKIQEKPLFLKKNIAKHLRNLKNQCIFAHALQEGVFSSPSEQG
jgi:hypothetical protein